MRTLPPITDVLRTPESCFAGLPDFPYQPHYTDLGGLRVAHLDEGPRDAPVVLLMHGEPTWSCGWSGLSAACEPTLPPCATPGLFGWPSL